jgi:hypothetical protein
VKVSEHVCDYHCSNHSQFFFLLLPLLFRVVFPLFLLFSNMWVRCEISIFSSSLISNSGRFILLVFEKLSVHTKILVMQILWMMVVFSNFEHVLSVCRLYILCYSKGLDL